MRVKRFRAWRPAEKFVEEVASVPYDVVDRAQAAALAEGKPNSFLRVVRAEIDLPEVENLYSQEVYDRAKANLQRLMDEGILVRETEGAVYLYSQISQPTQPRKRLHLRTQSHP